MINVYINNKNALLVDLYYLILFQIFEIILNNNLVSIFEKIKNIDGIDKKGIFFANYIRYKLIKNLYKLLEELNFSLEEKRFILKFCHKNQINSENIKNFIKFLSPATYEEIKDIDFKHDDFYEFREQILNFRQILSENIKNGK